MGTSQSSKIELGARSSNARHRWRAVSRRQQSRRQTKTLSATGCEPTSNSSPPLSHLGHQGSGLHSSSSLCFFFARDDEQDTNSPRKPSAFDLRKVRRHRVDLLFLERSKEVNLRESGRVRITQSAPPPRSETDAIGLPPAELVDRPFGSFVFFF